MPCTDDPVPSPPIPLDPRWPGQTTALSKQLWRSPYAASEDRNKLSYRLLWLLDKWRSLDAASEDRNGVAHGTAEKAIRVALAVLGERGSQHDDERH